MLRQRRTRITYLYHKIATRMGSAFQFHGGGHISRVIVRANAEQIYSGGVQATILISRVLYRSVLRITNMRRYVLSLVRQKIRFNVFSHFKRVFSASRFLYLTKSRINSHTNSNMRIVGRLISNRSNGFTNGFVRFMDLFAINLMRQFQPCFRLGSFRVLSSVIFSTRRGSILINGHVITFFISSVRRQDSLQRLFDRVKRGHFTTFRVFVRGCRRCRRVTH